MEFLKKWDIYGKPVTFYYNTSTVHKTYFGALLSILSFSLMTTITITSLINFLYQKPAISSNLVYFINKKFAQLDAMVIVGKLTTADLDIEDLLNTFVKYYRIVLHEKYFDGMETFQVAKLVKTEDTSYEFNVTMSIKDVFKEKEFSTLKIMSCADIKQQNKVEWASYENEMSCDINYEKYFKKNFSSNSFLLSFDAPNYSVDRKGGLIKIPHQNKLNFKVILDKKFSYLMETKYVVIEDDTNIYYTHKKYDAYFTMKRPIEIKEDSFDKKFTLEILMENNNNDQIVLISLHKYKLLDFLAKLGGIMKIITFMKMTGKFWSSYFYEKTLYKLIVKRKNPYLEQKRMLLEPTLRNISSKKIMNPYNDKKFDPETSSVRSQASVNYNYTLNNYNSNIGPFALPDKNKKKDVNDEYCSYFAWVMNKFCKLIYSNKEARRKKLMITDTLGLSNYLLHLDYIDRQIILEQQTGEINNKIKELLARNSNNTNNYDDSKENMEMNLDSDKARKLSETETNENFDTKNKMKQLVEEDD